MNKKKMLGVVAFIILIIPALLMLTGCPQHIDSLYGLKVTGDGTGGSIALYEDKLGGAIYAQRIDSEGKTLWGEQGVLLGSSASESYSFFNFNIASDGSGGAIVAWPGPSQNQSRPTSHLARIDADGKVLWQRDFIHFYQLVSDGSGGAIIAFDYSDGIDIIGDEEKDLTLLRIDAQGNYSWGLQGVTILRKNYWPNSLQVISDGGSGAIVIWEEMQPQSGATPQDTEYSWRIMAQNIDEKGNLPWGINGLRLLTNPENINIEEPSATVDGSGGAIAAWHQYPSGRVEGGSPEWFIQDICVQRIDSSGDILWQKSGIQLKIVKTAEGASPHSPMLVSDGSGGAIILWEDLRNGLASIYAQRVDSSGVMKWQMGGLQVCYIKSNTSLFFRQAVSDGLGGALVTCRFKEAGTSQKGILVQKLDSNGRAVWSSNGIVVTDSDTAGHSISSDGQGGAIVAWGVSKGMFNSEKAYVQRLSADGKLLWGENGIRLNP
jgi:hypothetical protein